MLPEIDAGSPKASSTADLQDAKELLDELSGGAQVRP
jgi:hypothetical protein